MTSFHWFQSLQPKDFSIKRVLCAFHDLGKTISYFFSSQQKAFIKTKWACHFHKENYISKSIALLRSLPLSYPLFIPPKKSIFTRYLHIHSDKRWNVESKMTSYSFDTKKVYQFQYIWASAIYVASIYIIC